MNIDRRTALMPVLLLTLLTLSAWLNDRLQRRSPHFTPTPSLLASTMTHSPQSTTPTITAVQLLARQATVAPTGEPPTANRPIGFASVFLTLQNPADTQQSLVLQSVSVVNATTGQVELAQTKPQTVTLMPLEHQTLDVQLTNLTGYQQAGTVRAIATYQVNDTVHLVESAPVSPQHP